MANKVLEEEEKEEEKEVKKDDGPQLLSVKEIAESIGFSTQQVDWVSKGLGRTVSEWWRETQGTKPTQIKSRDDKSRGGKVFGYPENTPGLADQVTQYMGSKGLVPTQ